MRWTTLFCIFILCIPGVMAVSLTLDKSSYGLSEPVSITVSQCTTQSLVTVLDPIGNAKFSDLGTGTWSTIYHTSSSPSTGTYKVNVECGQDKNSKTFTVTQQSNQQAVQVCGDSKKEGTEACDDGNKKSGDGCSATCTIESGYSCSGSSGKTSTCSKTSTSSGGGSGNTGSGLRCRPDWKCGQWSLCDNKLEQTRRCNDLKGCQSSKAETRSCTSCDESWICSGWSQCSNGIQTRICSDYQSCGTTGRKPVLQKLCNQVASGPAPFQTTNIPPSTPPPIQQSESFWQKYGLILILSTLILVIIITILVIVLTHHKKVGLNLSELKDWIAKETKLGTSEAKIRELLDDQSGWHQDEVNRAFTELNQEKNSKN